MPWLLRKLLYSLYGLFWMQRLLWLFQRMRIWLYRRMRVWLLVGVFQLLFLLFWAMYRDGKVRILRRRVRCVLFSNLRKCRMHRKLHRRLYRGLLRRMQYRLFRVLKRLFRIVCVKLLCCVHDRLHRGLSGRL